MDLYQFKFAFRQRLSFLLFLIIVTFIILIIKFFYLQIIQFNTYSSLAKNNSVKIIPIAPIRGQILDRNGEILAANKLIYTLELDPKRKQSLDKIKLQLAPIVKITKYDIKKYNKILSESHYSSTRAQGSSCLRW